MNLAYETNAKWKFDYTVNLIGSKSIPFTSANPIEYQLADRSPAFWMHNAQISKIIADRFDIYLGVENMLNFRQENAIISADDPNSEYFDASMVWGPLMGRNTYLGFRYIIPNE